MFTSLMLSACMYNPCPDEDKVEPELVNLAPEQIALLPYHEGQVLNFTTGADTISLICGPIEKTQCCRSASGGLCLEYIQDLEKWIMPIRNEEITIKYELTALGDLNSCDIIIHMDRASSVKLSKNGVCDPHKYHEYSYPDTLRLNNTVFTDLIMRNSDSFLYSYEFGVLKFKIDSTTYRLMN